MRIEIMREQPGALERKRWSFVVGVHSLGEHSQLQLRLRDYQELRRKTRRHRTWQLVRAYRFGETDRPQRWVRASGAQWIADPPCPDDVKAEAIEQLLARTEFLIGHLGAYRDGSSFAETNLVNENGEGHHE